MPPSDPSDPTSIPPDAGDGDRRSGVSFEFTRVRPARVSNEVVAQIREAIFSGRYQPGDRLPTERELSRQFGVSRVTVRDALRALEAAGLIEVRVGGQGGPYVTEPDVSRLTEALNAHVQLRGTTFVELSEARLALELMAAELAAERATPQELEQIRAMAEGPASRGPEAAGTLLDFHRAVVTASHNGALLDMWTACRTLIQEPFDVLQALQPAMVDAAQEAHQRLVRALMARDGELAARLTREHLSDFSNRARRAFEESRRRHPPSSG